MIPTHSHKSKHYFSNICQTKVYTIEPLHIKFTLSLIFIIALLTGFNITAKTTMADDSIFNSDKKSLSIDTPHMKLTQSVKLKKGIIYSDILNQSAINFYYINNPSSNYILYIKCIDENISPNYIQFFDSSYNELAYYPQQKSSYLYIDMNSILSGTSETKRIYVTIGNASASNDKLVNILYDKKKIPSKQPQKTATNNTVNSKNKKKKSTSCKSKNGNKIKKPKKVKHPPQKRTATATTNNKSQKGAATKISRKTIKKTTTKHNIKKAKKIARLRHVSLSNNYVSIKRRACIYLKTSIQPSNLRGCKYIWTTSNKKTATVSNGKVTGRSPGLAIIKVSVKHNTITRTATCTIRISK